MTEPRRIRVWDLPIRLFHWLLVAAIAVSIISGKVGADWIEWHGRSGLFIIGLIAFRVVWGFVGSSTARFANFVRGPAAIRRYLRGEWQGVGHNPLGALSVLALLGVVGLQVTTGLFANDDIAYEGFLAALVSKEASDQARTWHSLIFYALLAVIALHIAAIAFYTVIKRIKLLRPMLTGWQDAPADLAHTQHTSARRKLHVALSLVLALFVTGGVVYAAAGAWVSAPVVAAPAATAPAPAW